MAEGEEEESHQYLKKMSDKELGEKIARVRKSLGPMSSRLPDGGEKLRASLKRHEAESERRILLKDDKCKNVISLSDASLCNSATSGISHHGAPPSASSQFALHFGSKLDDQKAQEEELSILNHVDHKNIRECTPFAAQREQKTVASSRQAPSKSPRHLSVNTDNRLRSNGEYWGSESFNLSPLQSFKDVSGCSGKKESASRGQSPPNTRRNSQKTLVLLDEEELEVDIVDKEEQAGVRTETRVYYPSRDDPKAVEICYSDMGCLAPESYLSSPIMNFYIRYLQKPTSPRARRRCDYHIFNTYFYEKLKQDFLTKDDKETSFFKFRRWWKGVNIFEKAYIFLPIHENLHWSLVIISVPNKKDDSGPIILHLDSLGLHMSKSIFSNVKSFLIEEWKFLRQEEVLPELPIPDHIWDELPQRIRMKVIEVPQQKNEYDCGPFVLFFMERFLEEAPERLKKDDLGMFGQEWFKPKEASGLRRKIRDLLQKEFKNANEGITKLDC